MRVTVTPDQVRSAFEAVKDDPSFDESRGLWERGRPPVEMIQAMCLRPEILRAFAGFGGCVYPGGLLERRVKELVIITASQTPTTASSARTRTATWWASADILDEPLARSTGRRRWRRGSGSRSSTRGRRWPTRTRSPSRSGRTWPRPSPIPSSSSSPSSIGYINMLNLFNNCLGVRYRGEYLVLGQAGRPSGAPEASSP